VKSASTAKPLKISMGSGIAISTIKGANAYMNLPKRLQIPYAVPHNITGKTQGVAN
jgi:hypothetical protein